MADGRSSKRRVMVARQKRQLEEETKQLREFVADLSFSKIVLLQEVWERQRREIRQ